MLDSPGNRASYFKELTLICNGDDDCTLHLKHGDSQKKLDDFITYTVPVRRAKRFCDNGLVDYRGMQDALFDYGYSARIRKNFIQNYHGLYDNGCTNITNLADASNKLEKFVTLCKNRYRSSKVMYVCFNTFVSRAFAKLTHSFNKPQWGHVICCLNSIPPIINRSSLYDFRRCVYHMTFPFNHSNSNTDRDPCSRALMKEIFITNFEELVTQISLFFNRCQRKYFPKKDRNLTVLCGLEKSLYLASELTPEVLNEMLHDVACSKSVTIDVKRDVCRAPIKKK